MARPLKPFIRGGGYFPSKRWTPLVYPGGYTTMNGGEQPTPVYWKTITGVSPLSLVNAVANSIKSLTQYGLCTQASTPTPSDPVDIVCNNGAIKFNVNLDSIYVDGTPEVLTVSDGTNTQTASVSDLFAVGDYKDEQDIISGLLTHKVGIKVFDGTENWELHASASGTYRLDGVFTDLAQGVSILSSLLCTNLFATNTLSTANFTLGMARWAATSDGSVAVLTFGTRLYVCFGMSTVEAVKQYLAAQYAAGTPVIVLYPLATETTEQTTPHSLNSYEGTTVVEADTNVDPVTLSVEYASSEE